MKLSKFTTTILVGVLVILGACASPAVTPPPTQSPAAPVATTPVPTTPALTTPAPATAVAPAPAPAAAITSAGPVTVTYSDLRISKPVTDAGKVTATVTVTVKNTGEQAGTFPVTLQFIGDNDECPALDDVIVKVTLAGGASQDVKFPVTLDPEFAPRYTLKIGQLKGVVVK